MYINTYTVDGSNMMVSNSYKKEGLGRQMVFKWSQVDRSNSFLGMAWLVDLDDLDGDIWVF